jgi:T5SS/PEP-CTERM-associated repeat protein
MVGGAITLGDQSTGNGMVTVSGADTTLQAGSDDVTIGKQGAGTLTIQSGATLSATNNSVELGSQGGANGTVTVTGDNSALSAGSLTVGGSGTGTAMLNANPGDFTFHA